MVWIGRDLESLSIPHSLPQAETYLTRNHRVGKHNQAYTEAEENGKEKTERQNTGEDGGEQSLDGTV